MPEIFFRPRVGVAVGIVAEFGQHPSAGQRGRVVLRRNDRNAFTCRTRDQIIV